MRDFVAKFLFAKLLLRLETDQSCVDETSDERFEFLIDRLKICMFDF